MFSFHVQNLCCVWASTVVLWQVLWDICCCLSENLKPCNVHWRPDHTFGYCREFGQLLMSFWSFVSLVIVTYYPTSHHSYSKLFLVQVGIQHIPPPVWPTKWLRQLSLSKKAGTRKVWELPTRGSCAHM